MGSERQERMRTLGARLRALRVDAGLTGAVLAQRAGVGQPTVSKVENGRMVPSRDVLDRLSGALGLDAAVVAELRVALAEVESAPSVGADETLAGLSASADAVVDLAVREARLVRSFQCVVLPAMLQSAEYARHVFASTPGAEAADVGKAVAARVERQSVLYEPGRESVFVVTEGALRTWPGSPALMLAQLDRLLAVESLTTVRFGVLPWDRPVPGVPRHGFTLCDQETVVVETFRDERAEKDPDVFASYEEAFAQFESAAVFGDGARELLMRIMGDLRDVAEDVTP
ncbi:helix-turn-helix domain-containing protein [Streptomyces sp. NPDC096324]|uniref:helix-turn-helix domain-containing protein n=1 Tax=Streptomyces sp. NPDC096324 TaxID=3366085 RepID=UPI00380AEE04